MQSFGTKKIEGWWGERKRRLFYFGTLLQVATKRNGGPAHAEPPFRKKKQNYEILERCVRIFEQRLLLWCVGRYIHLVDGLASDVYHILNHLFSWGDLHLALDAAR